jgi:glycosyltransferase involved in cell wall biosynthesis
MAQSVFITARFRSGSTLLWNFFHQIPEAAVAYYEPLHSKLLRMIEDQIKPQPRHFHVDRYFDDYPPVEELAVYYREAFGALRLYLEARDDHPALKAWIDYLLSAAPADKAAILQFNRVDFRLPWLRANFPSISIVHLYRSPRDQWLSMIGDQDPAADDDLADPYLITTWARDLVRQFPMLTDRFVRHPYQRHYYLWKLSYLAGSRQADVSVAYEDILRDPRAQVGQLLRLAGLDADRYIDRCLSIIVEQPLDKWKSYRDEIWFSTLESECETILDDLGLNEQFGRQPLKQIIDANTQYQRLIADADNWVLQNSQLAILRDENTADEKEKIIVGLAAELQARLDLINTQIAQNETLSAQNETLSAQNETLLAQNETLLAQNVARGMEIETLLAQNAAQTAQIETLSAQLKRTKYYLNRYQSTSLRYWSAKFAVRLRKRTTFYRRVKKKLAAFYHDLRRVRLGRLHHYDPVPLKLPARYYRQPSISADTLPMISIVTPSYNQASFIERTICSVLGQEYPRLEYIIQDGASTDGTPDILERYRSQLAHAESRKDKGQTHAVNLGFAKSSGEIMAYLNSDDMLLPGTLHYVARFFLDHPAVDVVYGHRIIIDENDQEIGRWVLPPHDDEVLKWADYLPQETMFWRRRVWEQVKPFDESFRFALDWDFIARAQEVNARFVRLPRFMGAFRVHSQQKTSANIRNTGFQEMARIRERIHGREVSEAEVIEHIQPYLHKHVRYHNLVRFGLLRH